MDIDFKLSSLILDRERQYWQLNMYKFMSGLTDILRNKHLMQYVATITWTCLVPSSIQIDLHGSQENFMSQHDTELKALCCKTRR